MPSPEEVRILDFTQESDLARSGLRLPVSPSRERPMLRGPRIITDAELDSLPTPRELIEGIIAENSLAALVGPTSSFKSFLLLDWALCIQLGITWNGRNVRQGNVLYIYAEGRSGLRRRVAAWKRANHVDRTLGMRFLPESVTLSELDSVDRFLASARGQEVPFELVVIDTLNRCFRGNENSAEDMTRFIEGCDRVRTELGAAVLVAHHHGWESKHSRGSSALPAALDSEFTIARDGDRVTVNSTKSKDSEPFAPICLEFFPVNDTGSGVLKPVDPRARGLSNNQRRALVALAQVSESGPASSSQWRDQTQMVDSSFYEAKRVLLRELYVGSSPGRRYSVTDAGRELIRTNPGT